jgi:glycosyltransferase involved in cell wall biosynthesis
MVERILMEKIEPLQLSVCLITYKHENFIRQAIESILMQKLDFTWEIIIADDYSTDNTRAIILEYHEKHPELIRLVFQSENVGAGRNFVDLLNSAKGKYIAYLEGDDYWTDPFKLQKQFEILEINTSCSICYHSIMWVYDYQTSADKTAISNCGDQTISTLTDLINRGWFMRSSSLFFKNIKLPDGFDELIYGDYPLQILLANIGDIYYLNDCMSVYRQTKSGLAESFLGSMDIVSVRSRLVKEIYLFDYLNFQLNNTYFNLFQQKKIEAIKSYLYLVKSKKFYYFFSEFIFIFKLTGLDLFLKIIIDYISRIFSKLKIVQC